MKAFSSCAALVEAAERQSPAARDLLREEVAEAQQSLRGRAGVAGRHSGRSGSAFTRALEAPLGADILQRKGSPGDYGVRRP
jgi:hypothetical protein